MKISAAPMAVRRICFVTKISIHRIDERNHVAGWTDDLHEGAAAMNPDALYFRHAMTVVTTKPTREMAGVSMPTPTSTEKLDPSADCAT